jgi:hypothetical protein
MKAMGRRAAGVLGLAIACAGCTHETDILGNPDHRIDVWIDTYVPDTWTPDIPDTWTPDPVDPDTGCPDRDGDGVCDADDRCPGHDDRLDADGDGMPDGCDRCDVGSDYRDADGDGVPDACDCDQAPPPCHPDARCVETGSVPTCTCNPGYEGDGFSCRDIDECARGIAGCDPNATCTNTPGSFRCTCNPGYEGDGFSCRPIDHCAAGTHLCDLNATCTYTGPGTYDCTCNAGYLGDGYTCTPIDPDICVSANDGPLYDDPASITGTGVLIAMRFTASRRLRIERCEVFTGEASGTNTLAVWTHDYTLNRPHRIVGSGSFTMLLADQWQGVTFPSVVDIGGGPDYWLVWGPVHGSQASVFGSGTGVETRTSSDGGSTWSAATSVPIKFRCTCE